MDIIPKRPQLNVMGQILAAGTDEVISYHKTI